jgi:hypothetical protein
VFQDLTCIELMRKVDDHDSFVVRRRYQGGQEHVHQGLVLAVDAQMNPPRCLEVSLYKLVEDGDGVLLGMAPSSQSCHRSPIEGIRNSIFQ